ncbi:hypothetical protein M378DRAFT_497552 [Amanita muscaria Koide BX008]|uniref:Carbohydrate kinase PfkB domain-containing protein n=1 Tax=Amanita muscaria (strain Koide BX008) TaxID=946122 RepID=A0A0C2T4P4_AMAMK|nr:hypothetical protein M378DRAFT_497552 [Amanita muscaria Koide BX008]
MSSCRFRPRWSRLEVRNISTASHLKTALERGAPIDIHPEVEHALANKKPVVALETAVITHGLPQPHNYNLCRSLENIVRSTGSIPATIGMIGGRVKIGLEESEVQRLAEKTFKPVKLSRRDVAAAIATKSDGGTTCSATLLFAALTNIKVFSTGGLGGVHRGGENSMDISADLGELARSPVGLVSAGVKSILDIGRTLEYLETLGVPVISYSDTREFPAFFSRCSGFEAPWNVFDPLTAAKILHAQWQLGMKNGALIAVPIPEEYEAVGATIQDAVDQAVAEAERNGISKRGKEVTPWLLQRVNELTNGASLLSNIELLCNTARIGGQIAVRYHQLELLGGDEGTSTPFLPIQNQNTAREKEKDPALSRWLPTKLVVIGSAAIDITAKASTEYNPDLGKHSTTPGSVSLTLGGVGRNITEAAHRVMISASQKMEPPLLVSAIGNDSFGKLLLSETHAVGMRTDGFLEAGASQRTAVCNMILDNNGELIGGIADMDVAESLTSEQILPVIDQAKPDIVGLDGNLSSSTLTAVVKRCQAKRIKVFFEPTSVTKSSRILSAVASCLNDARPGFAPITFASPNLLELSHMYYTARSEQDLMSHFYWWSSIDSYSLASAYRTDLEQLAKRRACDEDHSKGTLSFLIDEGVAQMAINLLPFFQHLVIKCGGRGILVAMHITGPSSWLDERSNIFKRSVVAHGNSDNAIILQYFPAHSSGNVTNVTGAGDSFVGALLALLALQPDAFHSHNSLQEVIDASQQAARLTVESHLAVSPIISYQNLVKLH